MTEFVARFYDVNKCGYYPYARDSEPVLGGFEFLLEELRAWSAGKTLEQTRLPLPTNVLPAYVMGVAKRASCWVIVLWNEVPSSETGVASVSRNSPVGNPTMHENPIAANSIPGFPTYFLCLPESELVATLKVGDRITNLPSFKNYLAAFQELSTSIAVVSTDDDDPSESEVLGYMNDEGEILHLHPRFQLHVRRSGTQRRAILAKSSQVRKIVRVKEMDVSSQVELQLYQRTLMWLGLTPRPPEDKAKFRHEIDFRPTREELATVIDGVLDDVEAVTNDVGFVLKGGQSPLWLSGTIPSQAIDIDAHEHDGVFDAVNLATLLNNRKSSILAAADG